MDVKERKAGYREGFLEAPSLGLGPSNWQMKSESHRWWVLLVLLGLILASIGVEGVANSDEISALSALRKVFPALEPEYGWTDEELAAVCTTSTTLEGLTCRYVASEWHIASVYVSLFSWLLSSKKELLCGSLVSSVLSGY